ncbi:MAG: glucosamine-6-phosphate deaminase [Candidatus Sulfotelmatobacter sp.]
MLVRLFKDSTALARTAAEQAATTIKKAITQQDRCRLILATGTSQFEFLDALTAAKGIDWGKVEAFHLDEYVGIAVTHPASFRKILLERVIDRVGIKTFHFIEGDASDLSAAVREVGRQLTSAPVDIAFVGIGENGHIAFNDPPADFETEDSYIVLDLDEACRRQQVGEGWFADVSQVPTRAISMSPRQIMKAREIVAVVPDERKAKAVQICLEGEIRSSAPASILRKHPNTALFLDEDSASQLGPELRSRLNQRGQVTVGP